MGPLFRVFVEYININSFDRNCATTFPWPGCFKIMLAYMLHPENTKNSLCVCTGCALQICNSIGF